MASRKTATTDPLARYRNKRDFAATPEPRGRVAARGKQLAFVVQKHAARRLHYDFRLELDGTLKSWAVPKGPSLDPQVKRMAVEVEDHPLSYAGFEGSIPPGHYGAGTVIVWDEGQWQPHGEDPAADYAAGKLKFGLAGHKLHGDWTLVRMKGREGERQRPWLLIKERDDAARPEAEYDLVEAEPDSVKGRARPAAAAPKARRGNGRQQDGPALPAAARKAALPEALAPALATLVDRAPAHGRWSYEVKFDGYRLLARTDAKGGVRLLTRNGHDWTARMPTLAAAVAALGLDGSWLDGEIVILGADGVPDFQALQNAFDARGQALESLRYYVFDLPFFAGHDLRRAALAERRLLLQALLAERAPADGALRYSADFEVPGDTAELLAAACQLGLEGVIGKRSDAAYTSGRSRDWIKLKCGQRQEFVIGGYTDPQGSRTGFGALLLGVYAKEHGAGSRKLLRYAGNVGTGFDSRALAELHARLVALERPTPAFDEPTGQRRVHWVEPRLVCEVAFSEWTSDGKVRQAVFKSLREDKQAKAIVRERPVHPPASAASEHPAAAGASRKTAAARKTAAPAPGGHRLTHPERVVDAASGLTKGELFAYYDRVAPLILPHLGDRPVALLRAPDGIGRGMFFQKHADARQMPGVRLLDPSLDSGNEPLLAIDTAAGLLGAAQMNAIELHTWNARARAIEQPDRMVFDLDPGEGVAWRAVCEAARIVHELLQALALASYLKTSGGKGLHLVVPLKPALGWDGVKDFSQALVQHLARHAPERFVAKSGPKNRVGRIFVDYLRNGRGATTVAAFSARARPGLGISLPLDWSELAALSRRDQPPPFDVRTPQPRLVEASQAWEGYARKRQTLTKALRAIG